MEKRIRFIKNNYDLSKIDINKSINEIKEQIKICENNAKNNYPPDMKTSIDSLGQKEIDTSFYTGTGGNIYIYWKQYLFYNRKKEYLEKFHESLKTNLSIVEESNPTDTNSFFFGDSGLYLFYCIYATEINNKDLFEKNFKNLIELKQISKIEASEVELLYGTSGYLYCLLYLKKYIMFEMNGDNIIQNNTIDLLNNTIIEIFNIVLKSGIKNMKQNHWDKCLLYPFPISDNQRYLYLGAAHGLIGVLYILLSTIKFYPDLFKQNLTIDENKINIQDILLKSIKYVQSLQIESTGNFPADIYGKDSGELVHFCHGCVGALHLFILAEQFYPNNGFKETALSCNKCLWERGLLYKGNSLCHGMPGIVYSLIRLYKYTKDGLYLREAIGICKGTYDPKIQSLVKEDKDPQRKCKGIPDTPYSLMEGEGGCLVMYYDLMSILLNKNNSAFIGDFPGYEIN
jgi:hypothetical protein